jgi:CheY-like chemotaxis protein
MPSILLADDDPIQLELRKMRLEAAGHEVSLALNTQQAVRRCEQGADLVILDLCFPNAEGLTDAQEGLAR